jgi:NAD(P)-dependent dehydrogenase (short-subunit alcohol dehydrogenase family)
MRIFLAGASGVLGQRLVSRLVQAGHVVGGLTRSAGKVELLTELGAEPILCDVFDREALIDAVRAFKPDVLLNELTDLPDDVARIGEFTELNARIRTEGSRNLIDAARRSGTPKLLAQSVAWHWPTARTPGRSPSWSVRCSPRAALFCAMASSTAQVPTTSISCPPGLGCTSTRPPNERWRRSVSPAASS